MDEIKRIERFPSGIVKLPPSKSLSHRALISAALAAAGDIVLGSAGGNSAGGSTAAGEAAWDGGGTAGDGKESLILNLGSSEDISATLDGIRALGADWQQTSQGLRVFPGIAPSAVPVDCAESGSTLRFLIPILALSGNERCLVGRGRLLQRPMEAYEQLFAAAGATLQRTQHGISVKGPLRSGTYHLPGNISSQFVSGLLFALPLLPGESEIRLSSPLESAGYVQLTLSALAAFGVQIEQPDAESYLIPGGQHYRPTQYTVEADYSQSAYFLGAAALGRPVRCLGLSLHSDQGDRAILRILQEMGARISVADGLISVQAETLRAVEVDAREIPDLVPPIAVLCSFCVGTSKIVNAGRLRFKESDRLHAMASELARLGAKVVEKEDSLIIEGSERLRGGRADAWGDHRIAMSMALAAIRCERPVELSGWQSVRKSYPGFWEDFEVEAL
ncbi:MAG: 3-phosphoshikimate 1-carboxyvinyltransferase [Actinomycetia bacterium]|nr:3-phosphoshikimate 1-carboxyvinyltransferase [Actinomycetes bacterium]